MKIYIIALAAYGDGISGGDRIFIEFARRWSKKTMVNIYVWEEGRQMCRSQKLVSKDIKYFVSNMSPWRNFGFIINYFARIIEGIILGFTLKIENKQSTLLYSASEFWMDSIPCVLLKLRYPKITWVATWYQTAPNPIQGFSDGRYRLSASLYWLVQLPIKPLVSKFSDFVLVNNNEERKQFPIQNKKNKAIVVIGAVPLSNIKKYIIKNKQKFNKFKYDVVFQGRFHPQKGVVELIDIWKGVVEKKPNAKLAMIGDGPLMNSVTKRIKKFGLEKNIILYGYLFDGPKKYKIFSQSKIVAHPAFYDSGGMASAEAMAFGVPAVGFNLKSYESYYPKGMLKVKHGDLHAFSKVIINLLNNEEKRTKIGKEAKQMIEKNWSWDNRAEEIFNKISV